MSESIDERIKKIPLKERMELLTQYLMGLNLDIVLYKISRLETITRGENNTRIIIGEKPVARKMHYQSPIEGSDLLCPTGFTIPLFRRKHLKRTMDVSKVTCLRCLALLKELDEKREAETNEHGISV